MTTRTVVLLGAGFSRPLGGPLLDDILSEDALARTGLTAAQVDEVRDAYERFAAQFEPDAELFFARVWDLASFDGVMAGVPAARLRDALRQHVTRLCAGVRLHRDDREAQSYRTFFAEPPAAVLTFNYDLVVEHVLDWLDVAFHYGPVDGLWYEDPQRRRRAQDFGSLPLLKLHGSVNWAACLACQDPLGERATVYAQETPYTPDERQRCRRCANLLEPGIVPPRRSKGPHLDFTERAWQAARDHLRDAERIIAIGYSLPKGDVAAENLLMDLRDHAAPPLIDVVAGPSPAAARFRAVYPNVRDLGMRFEEYAGSLRT